MYYSRKWITGKNSEGMRKIAAITTPQLLETLRIETCPQRREKLLFLLLDRIPTLPLEHQAAVRAFRRSIERRDGKPKQLANQRFRKHIASQLEAERQSKHADELSKVMDIVKAFITGRSGAFPVLEQFQSQSRS